MAICNSKLLVYQRVVSQMSLFPSAWFIEHHGVSLEYFGLQRPGALVQLQLGNPLSQD